MWYTALPESGRIAFHIADLLLRVFKVGMPYQGAIAEDPHTIFSHHLLCWYNIVTVWCLRCHVPVRFPPDSRSKWPEKVVQMIVLRTWFDDKNVLSFEKDVPALCRLLQYVEADQFTLCLLWFTNAWGSSLVLDTFAGLFIMNNAYYSIVTYTTANGT